MAEISPAKDAAALTRHPEAHDHARHRAQLPPLEAMARKVETVHVGEAGVPAGLAIVLHRMVRAMEVHMDRQEQILLPAIRAGGAAGIAPLIAAMRAEHEEHDRAIAQIGRLTNHLTLPEGACGTRTRLHDDLAEFVGDLIEHMRLQDEVLCPPVDPGPPAMPEPTVAAVAR